MIRLFIFLFIGLFSSLQALHSQTRAEAFSKLRYLKDTAILVIRIEDYKDAIIKYTDKGDTWTAQKLEKKAKWQRDNTIYEFETYYTFSKYYFYNSSDSDKLIKEGDLSVIYDANGNAPSPSVSSIDNVVIGQCLEGSKRLKVYYRVIRFYDIINGYLVKKEYLTKQDIKRSVWTNFDQVIKAVFTGDEPVSDISFLNGRLNKKYNYLEGIFSED